MSKIDTFEKKIFPTASFPRSSGKAMTTENDLKVSNSYHSRRREAIMSAINPSTLETEFICPSFSILKLKENGSSVCVMQWRGVIKDKTLTQKDIASILANCFLSRTS